MRSQQDQRAEVVRALIGERRALVVGPPGGEGAQALPGAQLVGPHELLRGEDVAAESVVVLDVLPPRMLLAVARALHARAAGGAAVVMAVSPSQGELVAPALPQARVLQQSTATTLWLGDDTTQPDVGPGHVARVLLVDGPVATVPPAVRTLDSGASAEHVQLLEREVAELRAANASMSRTHRPIESSAAAALAGLRVQLQDAHREIARLGERLAAEVEVAHVNGRLFEEAREGIGRLEAEIRGLRRTLAAPQHRVAASAGHRLGRIPGLSRAARRLGTPSAP